MNYTVALHRSAKQALDNLRAETRERISKVLTQLALDQRPPGCKKLVGSPYWRIRVGMYRVIYLINDDARRIEVTRIAHRSIAYR